jgi:predicted short-subunit dehydrogenase-like oxidoreductase (DUF2520 family)
VPLEALEGISGNTGVFYPLQTLSFGTDIEFSEVPICLEANTKENLGKLDELAHQVTGKVYNMDSGERKALHLAAVFASNFSFHMYDVAKLLLAERNLDPGILTPLIMETARKATRSKPGSGQTGPADRNDREVIRQHLDMLKDHKRYGELYRMITESIISQKKGRNDEL